MAIYATGCLCCLLLAGTSCATGEEPVYDNPLRTSAGDTVRLADPFVYESDGLYYMTGTTASAEASGFDYYVSSDLVAWEYGGPLFRKSPAHFGAGAFWAPEVERYEGRFYMTYSCLEPERGVLLSCLAVSDRPEGPFEELYTPWFGDRLRHFRRRRSAAYALPLFQQERKPRRVRLRRELGRKAEERPFRIRRGASPRFAGLSAVGAREPGAEPLQRGSFCFQARRSLLYDLFGQRHGLFGLRGRRCYRSASARSVDQKRGQSADDDRPRARSLLAGTRLRRRSAGRGVVFLLPPACRSAWQ